MSHKKEARLIWVYSYSANNFVLKMLSVYHVCCIYSKVPRNTFTMEANTMKPDLGSYCLQHMLNKIHIKQMREQTGIV